VSFAGKGFLTTEREEATEKKSDAAPLPDLQDADRFRGSPRLPFFAVNAAATATSATGPRKNMSYPSPFSAKMTTSQTT
jgi:hypothetical protein